MTERDEYIIGKPPRIEPVKEITDDMGDLLVPPPGYTANPRSKPEMTRILLHHVELLRCYRPFMTFFLVHGSISPCEPGTRGDAHGLVESGALHLG